MVAFTFLNIITNMAIMIYKTFLRVKASLAKIFYKLKYKVDLMRLKNKMRKYPFDIKEDKKFNYLKN